MENKGPPWVYWGAGGMHENWAACVDENKWGVGVYSADAELFVGGFHRPTGFSNDAPGDATFSAFTGYISPLRTITLKKDSVFEYEYILFVGTLDEIRRQVYRLEGHAFE